MRTRTIVGETVGRLDSEVGQKTSLGRTENLLRLTVQPTMGLLGAEQPLPVECMLLHEDEENTEEIECRSSAHVRLFCYLIPKAIICEEGIQYKLGSKHQYNQPFSFLSLSFETFEILNILKC